MNLSELLDEGIMIAHEFLLDAPGWFSVGEITHDKAEQKIYVRKFEKLVLMGFAIRHPTRRGMYRRKEVELEEMDFRNVEANPVDIWLPFGLSDYVELYPGNIVMIAGRKSSGKSALMLNMIDQNQTRWDVEYYNSEMGAEELRKRLDLFPYKTIDQWDFKAYRRSSHFSDCIEGGTNKLILIDFLEIHDEFASVGKELKAIHDSLKGGIGVVALQKNPGVDVGLGGWRSAEVSRLYLSLDPGVVKVTDAKNFRQPDKNPNGSIRRFKLVSGCQFKYLSGWQREVKE